MKNWYLISNPIQIYTVRTKNGGSRTKTKIIDFTITPLSLIQNDTLNQMQMFNQ